MDVARLIDPERVVRLRRDVFVRMIDAGIFDPDDRVQLIDGVLVQMSPQNDPHARAIVRISNLLARRLGTRADVACQVPFNASEYSRPEPDVALWPLSPRGDEPVPSQPMLVIEIADSSVRDDRLIMAPIYAAAGVPEYWIVNLRAGLVEVHTDPTEDGYQHLETRPRGAAITLISFPDVEVLVDELVPSS
jgi:Uma2 family endonuclease